jgi:hypothetical protein
MPSSRGTPPSPRYFHSCCLSRSIENGSDADAACLDPSGSGNNKNKLYLYGVSITVFIMLLFALGLFPLLSHTRLVIGFVLLCRVILEPNDWRTCIAMNSKHSIGHVSIVPPVMLPVDDPVWWPKLMKVHCGSLVATMAAPC